MKKTGKFRVKTLLFDYPIIMFVALALICCVIFVPKFVTVYNLKSLCLQVCDLFVIACGLTFVQLNASIDFSCTSVLAVSSVVGAYIMGKSPLAATPALSIPVALVAMVAIGALFGIINGLSVVKLKMPAFIVTMSTMLIGSAFAIWFTSIFNSSAASIGGLPGGFFIFGGSKGYFLVPVLITLAVFVFCHWFLRKTKYGRWIYSVGTNPTASFISGIPVKKVLFVMFLICGLCAGVQSILLTARNQAGTSGLGSTMFINVVAAVIIGGTSVSGGFGGIAQTMLGTIFIVLINNGMNLVGVEWQVIALFQGILILLATLFNYFIRRLREKQVRTVTVVSEEGGGQ